MSRHIYWKDRPIGSGGGGTVYEGSTRFEHAGHERQCAIKLLHESMAEDPVSVSRFHREAMVGYELAGHTHVVGTRTFGASAEGRPYLVMDLEGPTFDELGGLVYRDFPVLRVVAAGVLGALRTLEEHGWVHGDVNAGNIFLGRDGTVKLGDFGKSMSPRAAVDADHGMALGRREDRRGLALVLARLATGAIPTSHDGSLHPLPDSVPEDLRVLIEGLVAPLEHGGLSIEGAQAHVEQHRALFASRATMLELVRLGDEERRMRALEFADGSEGAAEACELGESEEAVEARDRRDASTGQAHEHGRMSEHDMVAILARILARDPGGGTRAQPGRRALHAPALAGACLVGAAATVLLLGLREPRVQEHVRMVPAAAVSAPAGRVAPATVPDEPMVATEPAVNAPALPRVDAAAIQAAVTGDRVESAEESQPRAEPPAPEFRASAERSSPGAEQVKVGRDQAEERARSGEIFLAQKPFRLVGWGEWAGVEVSVSRGVWSSDGALVELRVRNDSASAYRIAMIELRDEQGRQVPGGVSSASSAVPSGETLIVPPGVEAEIALEIPEARRLSGQSVSLTLGEPGGRRRIVVPGMRWP